MKPVLLTLAALLAVVVVLSHRRILPSHVAGVPVARLAAGFSAPALGLRRPLPAWLPLPETGWVIAAGAYPPQPPFGASATILLRLEQSSDGFVASYRTRLAHAGFALRSNEVLLHRGPFDPMLEQAFEADAKPGGPTIYIAIRGRPGREFAQLTFWNPPAPRL